MEIPISDHDSLSVIERLMRASVDHIVLIFEALIWLSFPPSHPDPFWRRFPQ